MKSEDRKIQIINTTLEIIGEAGLQGLTTAKIASLIGITEAAIYRHFKSKEEILIMTVTTIGKRLSFTLKSVVDEDLTPSEKLTKIFRTHMEHIQKNRGVPRIIYTQEVHSDENLRTTLSKIIDAYLNILKSILQQGIKSGSLRANLDINVESQRFLSIIQFTAFRYSLSGFKHAPIDDGFLLWNSYINSLENTDT